MHKIADQGAAALHRWLSVLALLPGVRQWLRNRRCAAGRTCGECAANARHGARVGPVPQGPAAWAAALPGWAGSESLAEARARGAACRTTSTERSTDR